MLHVLWRDASPRNQQNAIKHLQEARTRNEPESRLHHLQKGLRALHLSEMGIIKLLLYQHLLLVSVRYPDPLEGMANQIGSVVESFEPKRARGKKVSE